MIVELLAELDKRPRRQGGPSFYDRLCEALCQRREHAARRAAALRRGAPAGRAGGQPRDGAACCCATSTARSRRRRSRRWRCRRTAWCRSPATSERWVPARYAHFGGIETLTCTPVSAGGRWLGVIFADRGGSHFELTEDERHAMWTLGKTAALAASVRIATSQQGRARLLQARIDLAREIHERVVQRLFGVSLVLGSEHGLSEEARRRCADEMQAALKDLREALERPLARAQLDTGATLRGAGAARPPLQEPAARARLGGGRGGARGRGAAGPVGAGRGAAQRGQARRPTSVRVRSDASTARSCSRSATTAPGERPRGTGMGLRLAAVEALGRRRAGRVRPGGRRVARAPGRADRGGDE